MIIFSKEGKFAFKDLLEIPNVAVWVNNNRYRQAGERNIKSELLWYVQLLKVALPVIG